MGDRGTEIIVCCIFAIGMCVLGLFFGAVAEEHFKKYRSKLNKLKSSLGIIFRGFSKRRG